MGSNIDLKYISNAIDELISLLGIKEDVPIDTILDPFSVGNIKGCIESIADYLGLPIVVNLSYVPANYQQGNVGNRFESSALATTDSSGRGVEGITAQVSIPSYLPLYGTSGLQGFPINVKISDSCKRHPEAFIAIMAHELSHTLLHSLMHKEKDNEFYTDLTAMILGFSNAMRSGRKVVDTDYVYMVTNTTTYGYLSDDKFNFAFNKISEILKKNIKLYRDSKDGAFQKLVAYEKQLSSYKKELLKFKAFLEYLDKNQPQRIKGKDSTKIVEFHQLDYADRFTAITRGNEEKLKETNGFCAGLPEHPRHYSQQGLDSLRILHETIDTLISGLKKDSDLLNNNVSTLRKYVGFIPKLKINRQATFT